MFSRKVNILLMDKKIQKKQLAEKLNTTKSNIGNKLTRDNFSEKEMTDIANALNCELVIKLIDKETGQEYQCEYSVNYVNCRKVFGGGFQI